MRDTFDNLPQDKKDNIINVSIKEFAKNGYENASTNNIVKEAGISKGILFHYFGSKSSLYLYLLEYVMGHILDKYNMLNADAPSDIFERLVHNGIVKLKLAYNEPLYYEFLYKAFINTPVELKKEITEKYTSIYGQAMNDFFKDLDTSRFRKDIDHKKAVEIITIFMDGLMNRYTELFKTLEPDEVLSRMNAILEEIKEYMEILKKGVYE